MTIVASGPISLVSIQNEFGGSNPIQLNEYYKGGIYVSGSVTASIPYSGAISIQQFYGAQAIVLPTVSQVSMQVTNNNTTYEHTVSITTNIVNNTGVTQYYTADVYINYTYVYQMSIAVGIGSSFGSSSTTRAKQGVGYNTSSLITYAIVQQHTSNNVFTYTEYNSSVPTVTGLYISYAYVQGGDNGPGTIRFTGSVLLSHTNLTGSTQTYTTTVTNTPGSTGPLDIQVSNGQYVGQVSPADYIKPNLGSIVMVSTYLQYPGIANSNTITWQGSY